MTTLLGEDFNSIEINDICFQSFPCQHNVKINGYDVGLMNGIEIYKWCVDHEVKEIPTHFKIYKN